MNTILYAQEMATPLAMFYLPIPFPKTELWEVCKKEGGLRENADWEDYNSWDFNNPVYINTLIGKEEMQKLLDYAYRIYYRKPSVIYKNIKELLLLRQSPMRFLYGLKALAGALKK